MFVVKRDGRKEPIMFDKITARIRKLNYGLNPLVDPVRVAMRVIEGLYDGVTTSELDNLAAEIAATMTTTHPDYAKGTYKYILRELLGDMLPEHVRNRKQKTGWSSPWNNNVDELQEEWRNQDWETLKSYQ